MSELASSNIYFKIFALRCVGSMSPNPQRSQKPLMSELLYLESSPMFLKLNPYSSVLKAEARCHWDAASHPQLRLPFSSFRIAKSIHFNRESGTLIDPGKFSSNEHQNDLF